MSTGSRIALSPLTGLIAAFCLFLSACGSEPTLTNQATPEPEESTVVDPPPPEPDGAPLFELEPSVLHPGETFTARYHPANTRGGCFSVSAWDGSQWTDTRYWLGSDANDGSPSARTAIPPDPDSKEDYACNDWGNEGPGPDGFILPEDIPPGFWRICEGYEEVLCARFTVKP